MEKAYPQHNEIAQSVAEEAAAYGTPSASTAALVDMYVRPLANLADNIKLEIIQRLSASIHKNKVEEALAESTDQQQQTYQHDALCGIFTSGASLTTLRDGYLNEKYGL